MSEARFACPHCPKAYVSKDQLLNHIFANHWKLLEPKKHGKPSKKKEIVTD